MKEKTSNVDLSRFNPRSNFSAKKGFLFFSLWQLFKGFFFLTWFPWPSKYKVWILRLFGARVGQHIVLKPRINIHMPWNFTCGDYCWIGEGVEIFNFENVTIGSHCCISQNVSIFAAGHNYRSPCLEYYNLPVTIRDGVWLCANSIICPGVVVETDTVLTVGSILKNSTCPKSIYSGNPAIFTKVRWK